MTKSAAFQSDCEVERVPPLYVLSPPPHADFLMMYHAKYESILQNLVQISNNELFPLLNVNGETQVSYCNNIEKKLIALKAPLSRKTVVVYFSGKTGIFCLGLLWKRNLYSNSLFSIVLLAVVKD